MQPRKILMLTTDKRIDRRILQEARSLSKAGWQITVVADTIGDLEDEHGYPEIKIVRFNHERAVHLSRTLNTELLDNAQEKLPNWHWSKIFPAHIFLLLEAANEYAPILFSHDLPTLPAALITAEYHRSQGRECRVIYDSHEIFPEQPCSPQLSKTYSAIECSLTPLCRRVMTVNQSLVDLMGSRYAIKKPLLITNAFDVAQLPPRGRRFHELFSLPPHMKVLLYQGNLCAGVRNLECAADGFMMNKRDDIALVFMGHDFGGKEMLEKRAALAASLGKKILIAPPVSQAELLSFTVSADIGFIPYYNPLDKNLTMSTPNKLYEFIAAGLPMLSSNLIELTRFVQEPGFGITRDFSTPDRVARAIEEIFSIDCSLFRANLENKFAEYTWQHQGKKLVAEIERIFRDEDIAEATALESELKSAYFAALRGEKAAVRTILSSILENLNDEKEMGTQRPTLSRTSPTSSPHNAPRTAVETQSIVVQKTESVQKVVAAHSKVLVIINRKKDQLRGTVEESLLNALSTIGGIAITTHNFAYPGGIPKFIAEQEFDYILFHQLFFRGKSIQELEQLIHSPHLATLKGRAKEIILIADEERTLSQQIIKIVETVQPTRIFSSLSDSEKSSFYTTIAHRVESSLETEQLLLNDEKRALFYKGIFKQ